MIRFLLIIGIITAGFIIFKKLFKIPKIGALAIVTGGVKKGKSTLAVRMAIKEYKKRLTIWKIRRIIRKIFKRKEEEKPLLYSNIPLNCDHVPLTEDLIQRKTRFAYKSVIYISEASLLANSMSFKGQEELNERMLLYFKLIGHETRGGVCILDTQQIEDTHYAIKRSISEYFYVHHTIKVPFFLIMYLKELRYSENGQVESQQDVEKELQRVIVPKSTWKKFDCYTYSLMTDNLKVERNVITQNEVKTLKTNHIVSFNKYKEIYTNE